MASKTWQLLTLTCNFVLVVLLSLLKEIKELALSYGHPKQLVLCGVKIDFGSITFHCPPPAPLEN